VRAVLNRETTVRLRVDDEGGNLVAATTTPTLTVTTAAGAAVTPGTVTSESTGVYKSTLPAQSALTVLTCNWTATVSGANRTVTQSVRVVSDRAVALWRYREDEELAVLSDLALIRLADTVEDWFRDALRFPLGEEYVSITFRKRRQSMGLLIPTAPFPVTVTAVSVNDTAFTSAEIADLTVVGNEVERGITADPFLTGSNGYAWPEGQYTVTGTHGPRNDWLATPDDLQRAAVTLARYISRGSNYPERARQIATDGALITLSTPTPDRPTGLPDVDGVVGRYRQTVTV
jgi:hypothetical protein